MPKYHIWTGYIIRKGFFLSGALLAAALILLVWASACPASFPFLRHYASYCQTSSVIILAVTLLGGICLEDILRRRH